MLGSSEIWHLLNRTIIYKANMNFFFTKLKKLPWNFAFATVSVAIFSSGKYHFFLVTPEFYGNNI